MSGPPPAVKLHRQPCDRYARGGGRTVAAGRVEEYIAAIPPQSADYLGLADAALRARLTPVFSWWAGEAPSQHGAGSPPRLALAALRSMGCGLYVSYDRLARDARRFRVPAISRLASWTPPPGVTYAEALSALREKACDALEASPWRGAPPATDFVTVSFESGTLAKIRLAQPMVAIASEAG